MEQNRNISNTMKFNKRFNKDLSFLFIYETLYIHLKLALKEFEIKYLSTKILMYYYFHTNP